MRIGLSSSFLWGDAGGRREKKKRPFGEGERTSAVPRSTSNDQNSGLARGRRELERGRNSSFARSNSSLAKKKKRILGKGGKEGCGSAGLSLLHNTPRNGNPKKRFGKSRTTSLALGEKKKGGGTKKGGRRVGLFYLSPLVVGEDIKGRETPRGGEEERLRAKLLLFPSWARWRKEKKKREKGSASIIPFVRQAEGGE